mmetsp:Transcript_16333/g.33279  ORF Transcript_16333/g.33279 Transcript_16333/m.33279 type:complete len:306 (-) Transcript_16333:166-1083(-)
MPPTQCDAASLKASSAPPSKSASSSPETKVFATLWGTTAAGVEVSKAVMPATPPTALSSSASSDSAFAAASANGSTGFGSYTTSLLAAAKSIPSPAAAAWALVRSSLSPHIFTRPAATAPRALLRGPSPPFAKAQRNSSDPRPLTDSGESSTASLTFLTPSSTNLLVASPLPDDETDLATISAKSLTAAQAPESGSASPWNTASCAAISESLTLDSSDSYALYPPWAFSATWRASRTASSLSLSETFSKCESVEPPATRSIIIRIASAAEAEGEDSPDSTKFKAVRSMEFVMPLGSLGGGWKVMG